MFDTSKVEISFLYWRAPSPFLPMYNCLLRTRKIKLILLWRKKIIKLLFHTFIKTIFLRLILASRCLKINHVENNFTFLRHSLYDLFKQCFRKSFLWFSSRSKLLFYSFQVTNKGTIWNVYNQWIIFCCFTIFVSSFFPAFFPSYFLSFFFLNFGFIWPFYS